MSCITREACVFGKLTFKHSVFISLAVGRIIQVWHKYGLHATGRVPKFKTHLTNSRSPSSLVTFSTHRILTETNKLSIWSMTRARAARHAARLKS